VFTSPPPAFTELLPSLAAGGLPVLAGLSGVAFALRPSRATSALFASLQALALLANAVVRQGVQIARLGGWEKLHGPAVRGEWSTVVLFGVFFVAGLAVLGWLVGRVRATFVRDDL